MYTITFHSDSSTCFGKNPNTASLIEREEMKSIVLGDEHQFHLLVKYDLLQSMKNYLLTRTSKCSRQTSYTKKELDNFILDMKKVYSVIGVDNTQGHNETKSN